jgi:hypothetical protein
MTQLFRDCYRDSHSNGFIALVEFWLRLIADIVRTAPLERWEILRKGETMKNVKRDSIGMLACLIIIVLAFLLLGYGRKNEVASILLFGYALDAIVTAGVIANLIIFLLMIATRLSTFRTALWSLVAVNGGLLLIATLIGTRVDPHFNFPAVLISYVVSFLFWLMIHWIWAQIRTSTNTAT